jgi:hypothetical protein
VARKKAEDEMSSKEKTEFRKTKRWLNFRSEMIAAHNNTCDCCGMKKKKGLTLHHKYKKNYDLLEPERFLVLCNQCHKFLHFKNNYTENIQKFIESLLNGTFWS